MIDFLGPLIVGILGSLHCLGMCGPLVLAYSLNLRKQTGARTGRTNALFHHMAFHSGRLISYGLLGALAGLIADASESLAFLDDFRKIATVAAGFFMLFLGLALLRILPSPSWTFPLHNQRFVGRLLFSPNVLSKYVLGLGAGFLPCMLPWAMLTKAATSGHPLTGFATMVLFGLGTVPVLFLPGFSASILSLRVRLVGDRLSGLAVIVMGGILLFKGVRNFL